MRILIVTDAWLPQVNGVVRTLQRLSEELPKLGVGVTFLTPAEYPTLPLPSYPEIRIALASPWRISRRIDEIAPDHVHIATEGPLGLMARRHCLRRGRPFTTSYHTKFPEYVRARLPLPEAWLYGAMRRFHNAGSGTMVATKSLADELSARGFENIRPWSRGVDSDLFNPVRMKDLGLPRPIFLNVGRVAVEKNLPDFLGLDLPGTKLVVGDGPELERLRRQYPDAVFLGARTGEDLAEVYASSDVFVFPSRTDTFGNVILEALASGLPVAAYPVTGPLDIFADGVGGELSHDLRLAAMAALSCDRATARAKALRHGWSDCARQFLDNIGVSAAMADKAPARERRRLRLPGRRRHAGFAESDAGIRPGAR